jgi:hypothetical protein
MKRAKRDNYIDIRSVHEAGHAIAAIRMRLRFSYVSIESALLPDTGGHTMMTLPLHNGTLNSIRRLLVVLFAGASAADHILELDGAFYDAQIAGDLYQIKATVAANSKLFSGHARQRYRVLDVAPRPLRLSAFHRARLERGSYRLPRNLEEVTVVRFFTPLKSRFDGATPKSRALPPD